MCRSHSKRLWGKAVSFINSATQVSLNSLSNEPFQLDLSIVSCISFSFLSPFLYIKTARFSSSQIAEMVSHLDGQTGQLWYSSTHEVTHDRCVFMVLPREEAEPRQLVHPEQALCL